ncbi:DNA-processing protein DprA [Candidatus Parcubacteria bacterium]|nr:DNA-processing protein DprA [Candidatus Parcubacteria bacterium]
MNRTMPHPIRQLKYDAFPKLLREIPQPPKMLYIRGEMPGEDYTYLCVVGSRRTSIYGRRMCASLIAGLAKHKIAIASGLALGIDAEAHKAALDVGLPTVACLPSSLDEESLYPVANRPLAARILARGGALLSEYKPQHKAMVHNFIARNRIMSGLSKATLIIEAGEKSGTLITARLALDYNREVMGIPHELGRETGAGVNRLLREGATLVRNSQDILETLGIKPVEPTQDTLPTDLTEIESKVLVALTDALVRDELIERTELSAQDTNIALSSLLIRGLITERLGKIERV